MDSPFLKGYWGTPENMTPRGARSSWHKKKWPSKRDSRDKSTPLRHDGAHRPSKSPVSIPVESVADSSSSKYQFQAKKKKNYKLWPKINPAAAAVKIQAAYRGFGVRKSAPVKNLKAIAQAKESMEEAKRRINDENVVNFIRQNEKERLRFTEGLMSLLLKLDAIQGASTIVRESRKAVIRELIKLQEIVDAIAAEKTTESEPPKNVEECVLQDKENIPEEEHVHMDIQASESNPAASFNRDLNSLENALEKKIILSDLENSLEKKIMLDENENADNKDLPFEKNRETSPLMKIPEEKDKMGSLDENIHSSGPANYSSEPLKNSSQSVKGSSELLEDSSESVKDSSGPVTFSTGEGVNDDDVSIENQEQVSSDLPKMETNESGSAEEDFRSVNREAILQEAFEMLDQIKSRIAECQLQDQIYSEVPLQGAEVANIVDQDEVKLKEFTNKPELGIHRMECSEEYHAGKNASNQGKISQQDGKHEANNSEEAACVKRSDGTNNGTELSQEDITEANSSEEAACVKNSKGTSNNMESVSDKLEDDDNESRVESTTTAVENVWEENKKLKKVMEDLYQRNLMQNDIIGSISKKLEQLEKRMLQLNNNRNKYMGKRKRT